MSDFEQKILPHFQSGLLQAIIDSEFELNEIVEAHKRMESNVNIGKILLKISNDSDDLRKDDSRVDL